MKTNTKLSSLEIRNLMMEAIMYEDVDIDPEGHNFKKYGYKGTQSDLFRLMEGLAIKNNLINDAIPLTSTAWGYQGYELHYNSTTNFTDDDILKIYEQFHMFINQGLIAPGATGNYGPNLPYFHVTDYGLVCCKEKDILPYDIDEYLSKIMGLPSISEWTEFYIEEALRCFNANCMEASIIMLGLANEKIIEELNGSLLNYLSKHYTDIYSEMEKDVDKARKASGKYNCYKTYFERIRSRISDDKFKIMLSDMDNIATESFANFTRITRNALSHPSDTKMERIEVLMIFISFVKYCEIQHQFKTFYQNN